MNKEASDKIEWYFDHIESKVKEAYAICEDARKKGLDPEDHVAIPLAKNMAERVEGLISVAEPKIKGSGISQRIGELEGIYGKLSWKVAFIVSLETAQEKFCKFENKVKAMETGIRVGLAYLTLGVVASPLEGFVELQLKKRMDNGQEYFCLMFSGPIRSAGGTGAAVSVLVADYIRKHMGYAQYDATENEVKRGATELNDYVDRVTNLQYLPSEEEIEFMISHMPLQVDGDGSEKFEVSNYKDIPRIGTNIIRNGFCLVIGECLCQKAAKLWKQLSVWGNEFGMEQWSFLDEFLKLQKKKKAKGAEKKAENTVQPDYTYIKDLVAGRPILGFPLRNGGFRLRYGRCRNTGYSSAAINPALTYILDKFVAIGTQLKVERPGKAASMSTCDSIEGPIVRLDDGSVQRVNDLVVAKQIAGKVREIIYLGDILFNYGDFFNRAHPLVPAGYCEEWWALEVKKAIASNTPGELFQKISKERFEKLLSEIGNPSIKAEEAMDIALQLKVPLHPKYTYFWNTLTKEGFNLLLNWLKNPKEITDQKIILFYDEAAKRQLELAGTPHQSVGKEFVVISSDDAFIIKQLIQKINLPIQNANTNAETISNIMNISVRDKCGIFVGARMGRPEKAKVRKLDGQPHCLFPVGDEGGRLRCFQSAIEAEKVTSDFPLYKCECGRETIFAVCDQCGKKTTKKYFCKECGVIDTDKCPKHGKTQSYKNREIPIKEIYNSVMSHINMDTSPDLVKGVRGTSNKNHIPEHLAKGILRAKHDIPVNKDGTTRYDMTQLAITHFKPFEIGTTLEQLKDLGYEKDIYGKEITRDDQIIELFPQDVILPACQDSPEEGANDVLFRSALFLDDLLVKLYGEKPFYDLKSKEELVGHLGIALAPHTSAGIVVRIAGFSKTQGFYAHPMVHAATRRDCDGDEACVTLLLDALLNFSRQYLPNTRGATQDAPLVLTSKLTPAEVDDMLFDVDVCFGYPLEFYESTLLFKKPWEIKLDQIGPRLNTPKQYEQMGFTHDTSDINLGVKCSAYKTLPSMEDKLKGQMNLAFKIRAVDESEVAKTVIEKHFIKDIRGNLRKFSTQQFRCVSCNEKFRRPPLLAKCTKCGGNIIFTISEGSIVKYLDPALSLANHYNLPNYLKQSLEITKRRIESMFGKEKEKQAGLGKWFG